MNSPGSHRRIFPQGLVEPGCRIPRYAKAHDLLRAARDCCVPGCGPSGFVAAHDAVAGEVLTLSHRAFYPVHVVRVAHGRSVHQNERAYSGRSPPQAWRAPRDPVPQPLSGELTLRRAKCPGGGCQRNSTRFWRCARLPTRCAALNARYTARAHIRAFPTRSCASADRTSRGRSRTIVAAIPSVARAGTPTALARGRPETQNPDSWNEPTCDF